MSEPTICLLCWDAVPRPMLTPEYIQAGIPPERLVTLPIRGWRSAATKPVEYVREITHLRSDDPTKTKCGMTIQEEGGA